MHGQNVYIYSMYNEHKLSMCKMIPGQHVYETYTYSSIKSSIVLITLLYFDNLMNWDVSNHDFWKSLCN